MTTPAPERPYYTVKQVATRWACSEPTVIRTFQDQPGVLKLSMPLGLRGKGKRAPRVMLRIPPAVLERVERERSSGWGGKV